MFSVTETLVLNPVADLRQTGNRVQSELLSRVIAVATSVFAVIDLITHTVATPVMGLYLITKAVFCYYNPLEYKLLSNLILNTFKFTMLTAFGSIMGVFAPASLASCNPPQDVDDVPPPSQPKSPNDHDDTSASGLPSASTVQPPVVTGGTPFDMPGRNPVTATISTQGSSASTVQPPAVTGRIPFGMPGRNPVTSTTIPPASIAPPVRKTPSPSGSIPVVTSAIDLSKSLVSAQVTGTYTRSKGKSSLGVDRTIDIKKEEEQLEWLEALAEMVHSGEEVLPFSQLQEFYKSATFETKLRFYEMFSEEGDHHDDVRAFFAPIIFQSTYIVPREVKWYSDRELLDAGDALSTTKTLKAALAARGMAWNDAFHRGRYFHATKSVDMVSQILTQRKLEVRQGCFYGVYLSTQPEVGYGPFIFAFKEKIALTSPQVNATQTTETVYWSGLAEDLDMNPDYVAYIAVVKDPWDTTGTGISARIATLQAEIKRLHTAGLIDREIPVVAYEDIEPHIQQLKTLPRGLPAKWVKPGGAPIVHRTAVDVPGLMAAS